MGTWRMDLDTAKWLANVAPKMKDGESVSFEECKNCGAWYRPVLGHNCDNIIDLETQDINNEKIGENNDGIKDNN
jgi:hypothetical protein